MYADFVSWLQDKDYDYTTRSEKLLSDLKKTAEAEKYYEELSPEFKLLESKMIHNKHSDLQKFNTEIKSLLRNEIVSRYYFQKGRIEAAVTEDIEMARAKEILLNPEEYNKILGTVAKGKK